MKIKLFKVSMSIYSLYGDIPTCAECKKPIKHKVYNKKGELKIKNTFFYNLVIKGKNFKFHKDCLGKFKKKVDTDTKKIIKDFENSAQSSENPR